MDARLNRTRHCSGQHCAWPPDMLRYNRPRPCFGWHCAWPPEISRYIRTRPCFSQHCAWPPRYAPSASVSQRRGCGAVDTPNTAVDQRTRPYLPVLFAMFNATINHLHSTKLTYLYPVPTAVFAKYLNRAQIVSVGAGMDTRGLRLKAAPGTKARHLWCMLYRAQSTSNPGAGCSDQCKNVHYINRYTNVKCKIVTIANLDNTTDVRRFFCSLVVEPFAFWAL